MQGLIRLVCLGYLVILSTFLFVADPLELVGATRHGFWLLRSLMPMVHFLSFGMLTVLMLAARWPLPRWGLVGLLVLYAGATEMIQSMLPPRTAEWIDWLQDVGGVAAGVAGCWLLVFLAGLCMRKRNPPCDPSVSQISNEWELAQNVIARSPASGESWWT